MSNELIWMNKASEAIAKLSSPIEAKTMADKAAAVKQYAARQGWSVEQRAEISEIEIKAVVKLGELLKQMPKAGGSGNLLRGSRGELRETPTLSDIGIDKKLSHKAQLAASVPAKQRAEYIAKNKPKDKLSVTGSTMWWVGDWLLAGESAGYLPRGKLDEACEAFGIAYQTAANASSVCRRFESYLRREDLSFTHHKEVAGDDDAEDLLAWAVENDASVADLKEQAKREAFDLWLACRTLDEISDVIGWPKKTVSDWMSSLCEIHETEESAQTDETSDSSESPLVLSSLLGSVLSSLLGTVQSKLLGWRLGKLGVRYKSVTES